MLIVNNLSKCFGKIEAVKDVSFQVKKGSIFAFLGTNGAGKTTVIRMMIDLLKPDAGTIQFVDHSVQEKIGVVFQSHRLDEALSIETNLMIRAKLYGMSTKEAKERIDELLTLTNLSDKRDHLYGNCSGGEKRKTDIIRALVHQPLMLILDEPTTGLDVESREEVWAFLQQLQMKQDLTIFLTTHYIEEAEHVDYVVIMHEGVIEVQGTPDELRHLYAKTRLTLYTEEIEQVKQLLQHESYEFEQNHGHLIIDIKSNKNAIPILQLVENSITHFTISEANLERVFLQITEQIRHEVMT